MKTNKQRGFTRAILGILVVLVMATSCTKGYITDPYIDQKNILTGPAETPTHWKLVQIVKDNLLQDTLPNTLTKQYLRVGQFKDNQGFNGNWRMTAKDAVVETYTNCISGAIVDQTYRIKSLSSFYLKLCYQSGGKNIELVYEPAL